MCKWCEGSAEEARYAEEYAVLPEPLTAELELQRAERLRLEAEEFVAWLEDAEAGLVAEWRGVVSFPTEKDGVDNG